jgi:hypothetical protein
MNSLGQRNKKKWNEGISDNRTGGELTWYLKRTLFGGIFHHIVYTDIWPEVNFST